MRQVSKAMTAVSLAAVFLLIVTLSAQEPSKGRESKPEKSPRTAAVEYLPRPTEAERKILEKLESKSEATFSEAPLSEVVAKLREENDIDVVLDAAALKLAQLPPDLPISLSVKGTRLQSVLNLICKLHGLAWMVDDEVVKITTPQVADSQVFTRTYPVRDLAENADELKSLKAAIEKGVTGAGWQTLGGLGGLSSVDNSFTLIVTQTWRGHQQVLDVLRMLRDARALPDTLNAPEDSAPSKGDRKIELPGVQAPKPIPKGDEPRKEEPRKGS